MSPSTVEVLGMFSFRALRRRKASTAVMCSVMAFMAIGATGCGSDDKSDAGGTDSSASAPKSDTAALDPIKEYIGSTGSGPADASATPVKIGFVNTTAGPTAVPAWTDSAQAAVKAINAVGGIDGHPLELVSCELSGTEAQGQVCAQKMLSNTDLKAVVEGWLLTGGASFHQTLQGKLPVFGGLGQGPDLEAKNAYYLSSGPVGTTPLLVKYYKDVLKTTRVGILYPDVPAVARDLAQSTALMKANGITQTATPYPPDGSDMTPAVIAAKPQDKGSTLIVQTTVASCVAAGKGLKNANVTAPVMTLAFCTDPKVKEALGDYPKWSIISWYDNVNVQDDDGEVASYKAAMEQAGSEDKLDAQLAPLSFMSVLVAAKFVIEAGGATATPAQVQDAASSYEGPIFMGPPLMSWKKPPIPGAPFTAAAGLNAGRLFTYKGNGEWVDPIGGWVYDGGKVRK